MASPWFLKLALNCIDHFAWPLLALGYPMCASVQGIETDSNKEMRDLISYWILLSLIYLFEYAFMRLLQWFEFWPYMKLMIIFWLIIPDFGRASYVYSNLIRAFISTKPQTVICRLNKWRKFFVKKEFFLLPAEKYVKKNGTEAFEKLITSKDTIYKPDVEETNAIRATCNKAMKQSNGKMLQTEHKDIKDLEVIKKTEIPAGKQDIPSLPNLAPSQNASSTMLETKGIAVKDKAGKEFHESSTHEEVQKEWTCALCQVTAMSEKNMKSHLHGKKHREAYEALKATTQPVPQKLKINLPKEEGILKNIATKPNLLLSDTIDNPDVGATSAIRATCNKEMKQTNGKMLQTEHKDIKDLEVVEKKEIPAGKQDIPSTPNLAPSQNASSTMVESKGIAVKDKADEEFPQSSTHKEVQKEWTCALCQVTATSEKGLNFHLHGKKHRAAHEALKAKTQPVTQKLKIDLPKEERKLKNIIAKPVPQKLKIDLPEEERKQKNIITEPVPQKLKIDLPEEERKQKNIITEPVSQKLKIDLPKRNRNRRKSLPIS